MRISDWSSDVCSSDLHLADYLALRGYRVLVVDCDPQASMSVMFDVNLEALVDETHTLSNFLSPRIDEADSLRKTIQKTAWPNIDICPANLGLQEIGRASCRERVCQYV